MQKSKIQSASKVTMKEPKPGLSKTMSAKLIAKTAFGTSIKTPRGNPKQNGNETTRTNKQNILKRSINQSTLKSSKLTYADMHELKKSYLSQSMVHLEDATNNPLRKNNIQNDLSLGIARDCLRNLLSIDEQLETKTEKQIIDVKDTIDILIYESIIASQSNRISILESELRNQIEQSLKLKSTLEEKNGIILQLKKQLQKPQTRVESKELSEAIVQINQLNRQNQILKKENISSRKDVCLAKKQLSSIKRQFDCISRKYDQTKQQLSLCTTELREKSSWLSSLQFQNAQLIKQLKPDEIVMQLTQQKQNLREYIYGMNRSYNHLMVKVDLLKRQHHQDVTQLKRQHSVETKKLRQKIRKNNLNKPKKKLTLKLDDSNDTIDWELDEEEK